MAVYLCADLHLRHRNIHRYRPFESAEAHDAHVKKKWFETVKPRDTVYVLGDVAFDEEGWKEFASWPGNKHVILGNHCTERTDITKIPGIKFHGLLRYKEFWLSHAPVHPDSLRGLRNIHGHLHSQVLKDPRYLNVSLENNGDFGLVSLGRARWIFGRRSQSFYSVMQEFGFLAALRHATFKRSRHA